MIIFTIATARNFLSCGNVKTTFDLRRNKSTLIIGENGSGKSTLGDLICFALYGKPYRNINKPQLVNSINLKNCETSIEFEIGPDKYKVIRGIKPAIFEIYKNDKLIDQEAATRDYQGYLEKIILKINFKTFCQVAVMGSAAFTPFMQLPAGQRRDVIEDVLDISVFSLMNDILKSRMNETKEEMKDVEYKLLSAKKDTENQKKIITLLSEAQETRINQIKDDIARKHVFIDAIKKTMKSLKKKIDAIVFEEFDDSVYEKLIREQTRLEHEQEKLTDLVDGLHKLTDCPRCLQNVDHTHKDFIKTKSDIKIAELSESLEKIDDKIDSLKSIKIENGKKQRELTELKATFNAEQEKMTNVQNEIDHSQTLIMNIQADGGNVDKEKEKMKDITANAMNILKRRSGLLEIKNIQEISQLLLKDSGIKAAIIKEYIPIINKLINRYLSKFNFDVNFILDENFNETIRSRGRDEFSYNSFSEGEKKRIDVAVLFAFRQVSELKNSANCNLLIMDEIVDSSLDLNSREAFIELLNGEKGNIFVISHTAPNYDVFEAVIKAEKTADFSTYEFIQ